MTVLPKVLAGAMVWVASAAVALAQMGAISDICDDCVLEKFANCGESKFIEGPNFDAAGNLWIVGLRSGEIFKVTPDGECTVAGSTGGFPGGARFDAEGKLLISDRIGLLSYDTETGAIASVKSRMGTENLRGLNDVVIDKEGGIYFTEPNGSSILRPDGRVFYQSPDLTTELQVIGDSFAFPNGVLLNNDQNVLYIAEYAANRILAVPLSGPGQVNVGSTPYVFAYMTGGIGPDGMLTDSAGNIYAAHFRAGEVVVYNASGFPYGAIRMPTGESQLTTNIAIHENFLYVTESGKNDIWRVKLKMPGTDK